MITSYSQANSVGNIDIPISLFEMIHNISMYLLLDDKHDLGRFVYYDRTDHWYHGSNNIHHESPFHHWQIAILGLMFAQVGSLFVKGKEMFDSFKKIESGDLTGIDSSLIDSLEDNTISLEEYKGEIADIKSLPKETKKLTIKANLPI